MKKPKQPCPKECPNRSAECHTVCELWLTYEKNRNAYYKWRDEEIDRKRISDGIDRARGRAIASGEFSRRKRRK